MDMGLLTISVRSANGRASCVRQSRASCVGARARNVWDLRAGDEAAGAGLCERSPEVCARTARFLGVSAPRPRMKNVRRDRTGGPISFKPSATTPSNAQALRAHRPRRQQMRSGDDARRVADQNRRPALPPLPLHGAYACRTASSHSSAD